MKKNISIHLWHAPKKVVIHYILHEGTDGPLNRRQDVLLLVPRWMSQIPAGS